MPVELIKSSEHCDCTNRKKHIFFIRVLARLDFTSLPGKSSLPLPPQKSAGATVKAAKLTDDEAEKVDLVKKMLGTDNTSEALRWCIRAAWATYGEQVEEIVKKKESVSPINL
ncbi:MAG: hypothetical protein OIN88_15315 [Candidatus Methanoperedens sp.]|nr:hypothetical protein [Candidatus Methanoperedens sp.]MCZ7360351.1 hypothetical protein [Candidatus Methanoperedens sp.]